MIATLPDGEIMRSRLIFGIGTPLAILLSWNTASLRALESRLSALETGHVVHGEAPATPSTSPTTTSNRGAGQSAAHRAPAHASSSSGSAGRRAEAGPAALLELDDPQTRAALADYLEARLEAREIDASYTDEADSLERATAIAEGYAEEKGLSSDVRAQVMEHLEKGTADWHALDRAVISGEIDDRDRREGRGEIEAYVVGGLTELLGEEGFEELAGRIW